VAAIESAVAWFETKVPRPEGSVGVCSGCDDLWYDSHHEMICRGKTWSRPSRTSVSREDYYDGECSVDALAFEYVAGLDTFLPSLSMSVPLVLMAFCAVMRP
jgi:hypothetical protein